MTIYLGLFDGYSYSTKLSKIHEENATLFSLTISANAEFIRKIAISIKCFAMKLCEADGTVTLIKECLSKTSETL